MEEDEEVMRDCSALRREDSMEQRASRIGRRGRRESGVTSEATRKREKTQRVVVVVVTDVPGPGSLCEVVVGGEGHVEGQRAQPTPGWE
jgi:hypothetical protein